MSTFIYHTECPSCGSSDGRAIYDDGGSYCFVCNKYFKGDEEVNTKEFSNEEVQLEEVLDIQSPIRGISPRIFRIYSYGKTPSGVHVYNAYNIEGKVVAQKFRYPDKTFKWKGSVKEAVPFGLHLWRSGGQRITITEGELDALSVAEALGGKYPVISIVNGASGAKKELAKHIEFLNSYGEVVLAFDNDAPGRKATAEVATLFPPGKVKTINLGKYKDFNEVLQSEGKAGVLKYYYETRTYTPDGIISGSSLDFDAVVNIDTTKSYMTPFKGINDKLRGLRKGELVTFTAGSGIGKTTLVREIAYDLAVNQQLKIGIHNTGDISLYDFSMITKINNTLYQNSTGGPNSTNPLEPGKQIILTYFCNSTTYCKQNATVQSVRISPGNCPQAWVEESPGITCQ